MRTVAQLKKVKTQKNKQKNMHNWDEEVRKEKEEGDHHKLLVQNLPDTVYPKP